MPDYTYTELKEEIYDPLRDDNISDVVTIRTIINRAARAVLRGLDPRGTKRNAQLTSKLFRDTWNYPAPSDLKAIIDIQAQTNRSISSQVSLIEEAKFDRTKHANRGHRVAIKTDDFTERLLFDGEVRDESVNIDGLDSLTANGTWSEFGNADNLAADSNNSVQGGNSLKFDLTTGGTTAGIQNTTLAEVDLTDYTTDGSVFVWVYIVSSTDITNFILHIGNDLTTNYYADTITTNAWGSSFENGWNLLRFDFNGATENGTVTDTTIDSVKLYMTKASGKIGTGYAFDSIIARVGEYHNILYYSSCPWQSSAGTYLNDSTTDTDLINATFDEIDLYILRGKMELHRELKEYDELALVTQEYERAKTEYNRRNPSERLTINRRYYHII